MKWIAREPDKIFLNPVDYANLMDPWRDAWRDAYQPEPNQPEPNQPEPDGCMEYECSCDLCKAFPPPWDERGAELNNSWLLASHAIQKPLTREMIMGAAKKFAMNGFHGSPAELSRAEQRDKQLQAEGFEPVAVPEGCYETMYGSTNVPKDMMITGSTDISLRPLEPWAQFFFEHPCRAFVLTSIEAPRTPTCDYLANLRRDMGMTVDE